MAVHLPEWTRLPFIAAAAAIPLSMLVSSGFSAEKTRTIVRPRTVQQRTFAEDPGAPANRTSPTGPNVPSYSPPPSRPNPKSADLGSPAPGEFIPWSPGSPTNGPVIGLPNPGLGSPLIPPAGGPLLNPALLPIPLTPGVIDPRPVVGIPGQEIPDYPSYAVPQGTVLTGAPLAIDDGYWIVSTRNCPDGGTAEIASGCVRVLHYDATGCVRNAELPQFHGAVDPTRPIVFVIHGSYNYWRDVLNESRAMYRWLSRSGTSRPVQMVFFTWPSDGYAPFALPLEVAVLGRRSAAHSVFLAGLIRDLPPGAGLCMIGHSHGARASLAAAHLLGGGRLENGQRLGAGPASPRALRAVLLAAAVDHQWLNPGERYSEALKTLDRVLLMRNSRDFWLSVYPLRKPFGEPSLSSTGLSPWDRAALGPLAEKVIEYDVSRQLGAGHNLATYYSRSSLAQVAGRFAAFEEDLSWSGTGIGPMPSVIDPGYPLGQTPGSSAEPRSVGTAPPAGVTGETLPPTTGKYSTVRPISPPSGRTPRNPTSNDDASGFVPPRLVAPTEEPVSPEPVQRGRSPQRGTDRSRTDSGFETPRKQDVESPAKILPRIEDDEPAPVRKLPTGQRGPSLQSPP